MNIIYASFNYSRLDSFKDFFSQSLTSQHKKILLIVAVSLSCLAVFYAIIDRCLMKKNIRPVVKEDEASKNIEELRDDQAEVMGIFQQKFPIEQESYHITSDVEEAAFHKYLFSHPRLLPQNKILLERTVCQASYPSTEMQYHHFAPSAEGFDQVLNSVPAEKTSSKITLVKHWFDYIDPYHFYIDFAHATSFGGAYRSYGCVQEERMFAEFPALALLDYKTKNGIHPCVDSYEKGGHTKYPPHAKPHPFVIEAIERQFDISGTPYGGKFQKANQEAIVKGIIKVPEPVPVNIIGLAAVDWRGVKNPKYQLADLIYHFEASYLAYEGAKALSEQRGWKETVVHTAPWGCGAFLNSEKMMVALQYLAAHHSGIDLVFHGIENPMNPHYTEDNINDIIADISQLIREKKSVQQVLEILLEKNQSDPTWSPK